MAVMDSLRLRSRRSTRASSLAAATRTWAAGICALVANHDFCAILQLVESVYGNNVSRRHSFHSGVIAIGHAYSNGTHHSNAVRPGPATSLLRLVRPAF